MTITIELPGDELVEMALRYHALKNSADSDGLEVRRIAKSDLPCGLCKPSYMKQEYDVQKLRKDHPKN
jgi:hypothetical protein